MNQQRIELEKLWNQFEKLPFPYCNEKNEEIWEIIKLLVDQEDHIAGLVSSYLQGVEIDKDLVFFDDELNLRIKKFRGVTVGEKNSIQRIKKYNDKLNKMTGLLTELIGIDG